MKKNLVYIAYTVVMVVLQTLTCREMTIRFLVNTALDRWDSGLYSHSLCEILTSEEKLHRDILVSLSSLIQCD